MHTSVFRASDILVYRQHLVDYFGIESHLIVVCVGVSQIVPTRTYERIHGIGIASCLTAAFGASSVHKLFATCERRFAVRFEFHVVGKSYRQVRFGYGNFAAFFAIYDRYRRAPVSLTGYKPVAKSVVGLQLTLLFLFKPFNDGNFSVFRSHAVEFCSRIADYAVIAERQIVVFAVRRFYHSFYLQIEFLCEIVISFVVSGNAHYRAGTVGVKHVISYPYRHFISVDGIDTVSAGEYARFFSRSGESFYFACFGTFEFVSLDRRFLSVGSDFIYKRMFGSEYYVRYAEYRIGAGREYFEFISALQLKFYFSARGFAYPVSLHGFCFFRPVDGIQSVEKFLGVFSYFEKPLSEIFSHYRGMASFASAVDDLFVGKNGVAGRTPVYRRFFSVSESVFIEL